MRADRAMTILQIFDLLAERSLSAERRKAPSNGQNYDDADAYRSVFMTRKQN